VLREIDGSAGFNEVFLTDVRVPDERRLGEVGQGRTLATPVTPSGLWEGTPVGGR
jgi:alkylation response protein AidB-like acyl-CoA dehydrogenase